MLGSPNPACYRHLVGGPLLVPRVFGSTQLGSQAPISPVVSGMPGRTAYSCAAVVVACASLPAPAMSQQRTALRSAIATPPLPAHALSSGPTSGAPAPTLVLAAPRHSPGARLGLQFLAASAGAVAGGLGTYFVLRDVSETRVKGDEGYTRSGNVGYLVGSFAGATVGAHAVGRSLGGKSPLWATSLGALVGTAPLIALGVDEPYLPLFGIALGWIPQAALAAGGFVLGDPR